MIKSQLNSFLFPGSLFLVGVFYYSFSVFVPFANGLPVVPGYVKYSVDFISMAFIFYCFVHARLANLSLCPANLYFCFLLLCFFVFMLHVSMGYDDLQYFVHCFRNVIFFGFVSILFTTLNFDRKRFLRFYRYFIILFVLLSACVFFLQYYHCQLGGMVLKLYDSNRSYWPATDPDSLGFFLLLPCLIHVYSGRHIFQSRVLNMFILACLIGLCFSTRSLSVLLCLFISLVYFCAEIFLNKKKSIHIFIALFASLFVFVFLVVSYGSLLVTHLSGYVAHVSAKTTFLRRLYELNMVEKWTENSSLSTLLFGGKSVFYQTMFDDGAGFIRLDNSYFIILVNLGVLGLITYILALIGILYYIIKANSLDPLKKPILVFFLWLLSAMFLTPYLYRNYCLIFFFFFLSQLRSNIHYHLDSR